MSNQTKYDKSDAEINQAVDSQWQDKLAGERGASQRATHDQTTEESIEAELNPILKKLYSHHLKLVGYLLDGRAPDPKFSEAVMLAEAKDAINALFQTTIEAADSKLEKAIDVSGNEFAMGYNDSGCFWTFYAGARGAGSMLGEPVFHSQSAEVGEALEEYLAATQPSKLHHKKEEA